MFADSLNEHLELPRFKDTSIKYSYPEIEELPGKLQPKFIQTRTIEHLRLPARLNSPLIPYPESVIYYIENGTERISNQIHGHHVTDLRTINKIRKEILEYNPTLPIVNSYDINVLKLMAEQRYGTRTELIHLSATSFASQSLGYENSILMREEYKQGITPPSLSPYMHFLCTIQRLRMFIARASKSDISKKIGILGKCSEPQFMLLENASYVYHANCDMYSFVLIMTPGHFQLYHSSMNIWFCGPSTYFDYMFTLSDINNNMSIIGSMQEYAWASDFLQILIDLTNPRYNHNDVTDFMKSLEGLLLNLSDYDEEFIMNWEPIMDILTEMHLLDQKFIEKEYDMSYLCVILHEPKFNLAIKSPLMKILALRGKLSRQELQELSSLHKFIYYSEVDTEGGIKKYLERVHTKRPYETDAVHQMVLLAKKLFFLSYCKKHNGIPTLLGSDRKRNALRLYVNKHDFASIESMPLSWWEDITIFNCMDNTMTDDALEFAKDKGALRKNVKFGPGDSRKELLQVIETSEYTLGEFFKDEDFTPKAQKISRGHQQENFVKTKRPVRLIPKEREQKRKARLYANGELSNKHALSVVATKLKKALNYFDEQLMTPSDKKRKELLHTAAQSLLKKDTYSLMLDIEGHNQSMQYGNTNELAEFCGMLFGETGWGDLPHYFSTLDIYHYDEYNDDVIVSNGQFGGIEGWLNPFWTLHTLIMMKLLRSMTDIDVDTIMVYSDDVNALLRIPQASTASMEATFNKITSHCIKFGMVAKMSQTNLSKHRVTMLRQHYADGQRADSTLKKLISTSGANNPMLFSESIEVAGICSSISSALEMTNHVDTCTYLKNYKIAVLLARLPHIILSKAPERSYLSIENLPPALSVLLYQIKDDTQILSKDNLESTLDAAMNDISAYIKKSPKLMNKDLLGQAIRETFEDTVDKKKFADQPDRLLYLQIYDRFIMDLLFYWTYLPVNLGGLGGSLTLNLVLSGHSSGMSKSLHYMKEWIVKYSSNPVFFLGYLQRNLSVDSEYEMNLNETRLIKSYWPSEIKITDPVTSISQSIKSMIKWRAKNKNVLKLIKLGEEYSGLSSELIEIFRDNFHPRIAQFYYENTSIHFIDLLVNKIETSSGLLSFIKSISRLRQSLVVRTMQNIRIGASEGRAEFGILSSTSDIIQYLLDRRSAMFPKINLHSVDEPLYDDKLIETSDSNCLATARKCSPMHFDGGIKVYDTPDMGNEIRYKGELLDDDRMLGNKEELIAARLVAVTKWLITKLLKNQFSWTELDNLDCVLACNLALKTLTNQTISELWNFSPNETGGEILHRIPNMRFSNTTYIRSEQNRVLQYTVDLSQRIIFDSGWLDSNINFDYIRLRLLLLMAMRSKSRVTSRVVTRWNLIPSSTIQDVQFITPRPTTYKLKGIYTCYGEFREHKFSELRFRYMATQYLHLPELMEMAIMPNLEQTESSHMVTRDLISEITLNYSIYLDKEYMRYHPMRIERDSWKPLIEKISRLDKSIQDMEESDQIIMIREYLLNGMKKHQRVSLIDKGDRISLTLQSSCLSYLRDNWPLDEEFTTLTIRYRDILNDERVDKVSIGIINRYRKKVDQLEDKRDDISRILICEYLLLYQFHSKMEAGSFKLNTRKMINELKRTKLSEVGLLFLDPNLAAKMRLIGYIRLNEMISIEDSGLLDILDEVSSSTNLADVIVPTVLPTLSQITTLTGNERIPNSIRSCSYIMTQLSMTSMETLSDIDPLLRYARKCVDTASEPDTFTSITGSDSMTAQYGLFSMLKNEGYVDEHMSICDLTAGRGDGLYISKDLGLNFTSFSRIDTFTSVYFHPKTEFRKSYDITKTSTLRFLTDYQWVHCDVSFTGKDQANVLDLILFLEENNIAYSIRLNSVSINGYSPKVIEGLPEYDHYLTYPVNDTLKPYQVYMVGIPSSGFNYEDNKTMKESTAFRSIALSYSRLLKYNNFIKRNDEYKPNSMTLYLGSEEEQHDLITDISSTTKGNTYRYYLSRILANSDDELMMWFVPELMDPKNIFEVRNVIAFSLKVHRKVYESRTPLDIGEVSDKILPYHEKHLVGLQSDGVFKIQIDLRALSIPDLVFFRRYHPLATIRSLCESFIRIREIEPGIIGKSLKDMRTIYSSLGEDPSKYQTKHQSDYQDAVRLMVLAAAENDYTYGIKYLHSRIRDRGLPSDDVIRMMKMYRLLSHLFDIILDMIRSGVIRLSWIQSTRDMMITRKQKMFKHQRKRVDILGDYMQTPIVFIDLEIDFDKFFMDLEKSIFKDTPQENFQAGDQNLANIVNLNDITIDMKIDDAITNYLNSHKELTQDKYGRYMVDDQYEDNEDLW
jgi:hypothetical protein